MATETHVAERRYEPGNPWWLQAVSDDTYKWRPVRLHAPMQVNA